MLGRGAQVDKECVHAEVRLPMKHLHAPAPEWYQDIRKGTKIKGTLAGEEVHWIACVAWRMRVHGAYVA